MRRSQFRNWLFDQHLDEVRDQVFDMFPVSQSLPGVTFTWFCRFDSAKLFDRFGVRTGVELHFVKVCNN